MSVLAMDGGAPVRENKLAISIPDIGKEEAIAASEVIENGWVTEGPKTKEFEQEFAKVIGTKHAIAANSGTSALHMLVRALGIKQNMKVAVPSFTFISSANCILFEKAVPVFTEVYDDTYNMDTGHLKELIKKQKIDAILPVDLFGHAADWDEINEISEKHNIPVIEDSAESHLAEYKGKKCGTFGKAGVFSFYPTKNMTTGEGGMITTNDDKIAELCRKIKNHGRLTVNEDHEILGYTYRISDILSAVGLVQLKKLQGNVEKRREIAKKYSKAFSNIDGLQAPVEKQGCKHVYMNYVLRIDSEKFKQDRDYFVKALNAEGINSKVYFYPPVHLQPLYKEMFGFKGGEFKTTEKIANEVLSLPMSPFIKDEDAEDVISAVEKVANALRK